MPQGQAESLLSGYGGGGGDDEQSMREQNKEAGTPEQLMLGIIQDQVWQIWKDFKADRKYKDPDDPKAKPEKLTNVTALKFMTKLRQRLLSEAGFTARSQGGRL